MARTLQYLTDPLVGFQTKNGSLNTAGIIRVFDAATDDPAVTYKDFVGTRNAQDIRLDDNGRAVIIADDSRAYRVEVRDQYGALLYNQSPMYAKGGGGGSVGGIDIISSDETVNIEATSEGGVKTFDLSVDKDDPEYVVCDSYYVMGSGSTGSGYIVPQDMSEGNMTVDSRGILLIGGHHYHIDAWLTVTADPDSANPTNEYRQREMTLNFRLDADGTPVDMVFDNSFAHSDSFTLSGDLHPTSDTYLKIYFDNYEWADYSSGSMPSAHISMPRIDVHSIVGSYNGTGGGSGGSLPPATPADEGKVLTVDEDGLPEWRSLGEDSSYAIANGSVTFTPGQYYTDGVVTLSNIRSNDIEYAYNNDGWVLEKDHTYVIAFNIVASVGYAEPGRVGGRVWLDGYQESDQVWQFSLDTSATHNESLVGTAIVCPQSTGEVHLNIRFDSNQLAHIPSASVNKAEIVDVTARVSGGGGDTPQYRPGTGIDIDGDVISIDPTETQEKLTAGVNIDIDSDNIISTGKSVVAAGSNVSVTSSYDGLTKTTTYTVSSQQGEQPVQSDWSVTDNQSLAFIKNKPQNLVQDPAYVHTDNNFTNADVSKLSGIAAGAEVNVQSDWSVTDTSSDAYIANKPQNLVQDASYVHTDNNFTNSDKNKLDGIEAGAEANVQSDWNVSDNTSDAFIRNKPTIPSGNQLLPSATSADENKVLTVDSNGDPEWATAQPVSQVQSDWTELDTNDPAYIVHKPTVKNLIAGAGISITETAQGIVISLA